MNNRYDDQWGQLKNIQPSQKEKEALRARLLQTLKSDLVNKTPKKRYQWTALLASCLFLLICGGVIWKVVSEGANLNQAGPRNADEQPSEFKGEFSWGLKDVQIKQSENGWDIISEKTSSKVGNITLITDEEMKQITSSLPMYVKETLEKTPYLTTMNIEHVKMMDTMLRYHFFIPVQDHKLAHFAFDYPKLEYADIFKGIYTLNIEGITPVKQKEQVYVKHGYEIMIFPVGLESISTAENEQIYYWENASLANYQQYIDEISNTIYSWKKEASNGSKTTFVSADGGQILTITLEDKNLVYEFTNIRDENE